jgi:hypothetical protein
MPGRSLRPPTRYPAQQLATGAPRDSRISTVKPFSSTVSSTSAIFTPLCLA